MQVIAAEGELQASKALGHAARTVVDCPQALQVPCSLVSRASLSLCLQLRFLQTLNNISEDSDIIMFPLPLNIISWLARARTPRRK